MDSVTHIFFGAAVGQAMLGKKEGSKAMVWGAIAQTVPDLDVFAALFMDPVSYLSIHRGFTHSIFFPFIAAPLLAWLACKIHAKTAESSYREWLFMFFVAILAHPLMDLFTGYGTQLFYPITRHAYELNTIFIIDPIFTIPLIIGVIYSFLSNRKRFFDTKPAGVALAISLSYLIFTCALKLSVMPEINRQLHEQNIEYQQKYISPTPFNSIFWRVLIEVDDGYKEGYISLFDQNAEMDFNFIPRNRDRIEPYSDTYAYRELMWFSKGFYSVTEENDTLYFNDLRFGTIPGWTGEINQFVFRFRLYEPHDDTGELSFSQVAEFPETSGQDWIIFLRSVFGRE